MSETGRAQKVKAAQAAARRADRRRKIGFGVGAAVVVVALAGGVAALASGSNDSSAKDAGAGELMPASVTGATTVQQATKTATNPTSISGVLAWDTTGWPGDGNAHQGALQHDHVTGKVSYTIVPPVGGPHAAIWMNAGVYTKPVPTERAVHNLEHGAVWITYRPDLPASQVQQLVDFVGKQSLIDESSATRISGQQSRFMDLSPWANSSLPSPIVISSWGYQLRVTSPTDPRLYQFVDTFRNSEKYTPEYGESVDGVPVETGGRAAQYGATKPNPAGKASSGM